MRGKFRFSNSDVHLLQIIRNSQTKGVVDDEPKIALESGTWVQLIDKPQG